MREYLKQGKLQVKNRPKFLRSVPFHLANLNNSGSLEERCLSDAKMHICKMLAQIQSEQCHPWSP